MKYGIILHQVEGVDVRDAGEGAVGGLVPVGEIGILGKEPDAGKTFMEVSSLRNLRVARVGEREMCKVEYGDESATGDPFAEDCWRKRARNESLCQRLAFDWAGATPNFVGIPSPWESVCIL